MKIASSLLDLIGNTPLLRMSRYAEKFSCQADILGKLECFNPLSSSKDRVGISMIEDAEARGILRPDSVIIEPTSGNTGIGLAFAAVIKGYKLILTMPETMSIERRKLLSQLGAEIVLTSADLGMSGSIVRAEELAAEYPNSWIPQQFENPANSQAHVRTTAPEIWRDTEGKLDIFVATFGTGGTISGCGEYLKAQNPNIKIVGVEPASSPLVSKGYSGSHKIQGIGANFVPKILDLGIIDEVIAVDDSDALETSRAAAKTEGVLLGISSGAALAAARMLALRPENAGKVIVALLPDSGERYISTELFD